MSGSNGNGSGNGSGEGKPSDWGFFDLETAMSTGPTMSGWDLPAPLARTMTTPEFPVGVLPGVVEDMVNAVAAYVQVPRGMAATCALGAMAAVYGGYVLVDEAGDGSSNRDEPVNLFMGCVAASGDRKSAVQSLLAYRPLGRLSDDLVAATEAERVGQALKKALLDAASSTLSAALTVDSSDDEFGEAIGAQIAAAGLVVTPVPRITANDMTPEAMVSLLADQGGSLAAVSAEGNIFNMLAGQYSGKSNLGGVLMAHAGDTIEVDRKSRAPEKVKKPALTISLMVQPGVLAAAVGAHGALSESGFLARLVLDLSPSLVGTRDIDARVPIPAAVQAAYEKALVDDGLMLRQPAVQRTTDKKVIRLLLSAGARTAWKAYCKWTEPRIHEVTGDLAHMRAWVSKSQGLALRLAGLFHVMEQGLDVVEPITPGEMARAIAVTAYYLEHYRAACVTMSADDPHLRLCGRVVNNIVDRGLETVSTSIFLGKGHPSWAPSAVDLREVFATLVEFGWLRQQEEVSVSGPRGRGRPRAPVYVVNKWAFEDTDLLPERVSWVPKDEEPPMEPMEPMEPVDTPNP